MTQTPLEYLQRDEWTMGNGQCPECYGQNPHGGWTCRVWWTESKGHKDGCRLALSIAALGGDVVWRRDWVIPQGPEEAPDPGSVALQRKFDSLMLEYMSG